MAFQAIQNSKEEVGHSLFSMCQSIGWHQLWLVNIGELCEGYHQQHHQPALPFVEQAWWCIQCQVTGNQQ